MIVTLSSAGGGGGVRFAEPTASPSAEKKKINKKKGKGVTLMLPEDEGKVEKHKMGGVKGKDKKAAQAPTSVSVRVSLQLQWGTSEQGTLWTNMFKCFDLCVEVVFF
jgi:hypothetical protein